VLPELGTSWRGEINVTVVVQGDGGGNKLCVENGWKEI
jgi:hypothetical protein